MMFSVRWEDTAVDELTILWADADSPLRQRITAASHQVDQLLLADPLTEVSRAPTDGAFSSFRRWASRSALNRTGRQCQCCASG